jgi:hypothetical protein
MLPKVLWLVLGNESMQSAYHVWEEAVVLARDGSCYDAVFMAEEVGVVNVEGGKII